MINTYLFDLDDTLIDVKIYRELYGLILKSIKEELNLSDKEMEDLPGKLNLKMNSKGRLDTGEMCRKLGLLELYYEKLNKLIDVMPVLNEKVKEVFTSIAEQGKRIGIVSNSMDRTIRLYLRKYALMNFVDFIFSCDSTKSRKNDIKYWKKLIEFEKLAPEECLIIGDDPVEDVEVPESLGFNTKLVKNPDDFKELLES